MKTFRFFWVIILGFMVITLSACGGGGGDSVSAIDQNETVLAPNAKALDTATTNNLSSVSADGLTINFSRSTPQLESLKTGDVILSGVTDAAPKGLLRKIVSTYKAADGSVQMITSPATLTEAFEELHLKGAVTSESSNTKAPKSTEKSLSTNIPKISVKDGITHLGLSGEYDSTLSSNFTFSPALDYEIDISKFTLKRFKLALRGPANYDLDGNLTVVGTYSFSPEMPLTDIPIFIATIPTGNPLINFTLEFIPSVGIDFSAERKLNTNFGFKYSCNITSGIEYNNGNLLPVKSYDNYSFDPYFNMDDTINFSIKPYFRGKIGFYINDIVGPYFDLRPYGMYKYIATPNPQVEKGFGITGNAGGELKVLVGTLASINVELFDIYYRWTSSPSSAPSTPTGFAVTSASSSQINLSWNAPSGTVTGYKVYKGGTLLKSITTTSTSDTGLSASTNYCYYVTAYNSAGESVQTSQLCATTQAPPSSAPSTPTGFAVTAASSSQINLSWNASPGAVTGYKVYKGGNYLKTVTTTSTSDTGLNASTNYCYYVTAYNSVGESVQTSQLCATTTGTALPGDTWTQKADFGGGGRWSAVGFSIGSKGYLGTGSNASLGRERDFWEYDPAANTWTQKADYIEGSVVGAVGFSIGSKGYIGTGWNYRGEYLKVFWEYDPAANTWTQKADFGGTGDMAPLVSPLGVRAT